MSAEFAVPDSENVALMLKRLSALWKNRAAVNKS